MQQENFVQSSLFSLSSNFVSTSFLLSFNPIWRNPLTPTNLHIWRPNSPRVLWVRSHMLLQSRLMTASKLEYWFLLIYAFTTTPACKSSIGFLERGPLSRLKSGGRRSEKAGLEERIDVCVLVHVNCYCAHNVCRHARLGRVQTGKLFFIGQRPVVAQTGRPHAGDASASRPRTPLGQVNILTAT